MNRKRKTNRKRRNRRKKIKSGWKEKIKVSCVGERKFLNAMYQSFNKHLFFIPSHPKKSLKYILNLWLY
jgi:hypothetical protein